MRAKSAGYNRDPLGRDREVSYPRRVARALAERLDPGGRAVAALARPRLLPLLKVEEGALSAAVGQHETWRGGEALRVEAAVDEVGAGRGGDLVGVRVRVRGRVRDR
eukprot:scaffold100860_cov62-Phaeocystis_antarctica.AAC.1